MSLPVLLTSDMLGAPNLTPTNGSLNALLLACLVNGFNTQSVVSATASSGVVTFNFSSDPGFSALDTVTISGASNATVNGQFRVQSAASSQVLVPIPGVPDGAVGGTITLKFSPLGWTRPYSGTGIGCYRQGGASATKRYARVYDNGVVAANYSGAIRGYEAMTAVSTGTGAFPTTAQVAGNGHQLVLPYDFTTATPSGQNRAWVLVGTPRFFAIYFDRDRNMDGATATKYTVAETPPSSYHGFWFGELSDVTKPADAFACVCSDYSLFSQHIARSASGTGTAVAATLSGLASATLSLAMPYPSSADSALHFGSRPFVADTAPATLRGFVPGALCAYEGVFTSAVAPPAFAEKMTSVAGVTGRVMLARNTGSGNSDVGWLLDEDWGDV